MAKGRKNRGRGKPQEARERKPQFKRDEDKPDRRERYNECNDSGRSDTHEWNDISWYTRNPNLLVAAGQFPFPYRPGMEMNFGALNVAKTAFRIPGVMQMRWVPTVGRCLNSQDPASIVAKEIYGKVRAKYSGSLEADAPDFVIYLMALSSVYSYIAGCKRIYRAINAYNPDNYVVPDGLLAAMGLNREYVQQIRSNLMRFHQNINTLVLESRKFSCPALMDILNRHYWMNDHVYSDAQGLNSQLYVFAQFKYLIFNPSTPGGGLSTGDVVSGLTYVDSPMFTTGSTDIVGDMFSFGESLIQALVTWDDAYTINGYLQRAYEGVPNFVVEELGFSETLEVSFDPEVLAQIENSRGLIFGSSIEWNNLYVTQDPRTNAIICENRTSMGTAPRSENVAFAEFKHLLSIRSPQPTVADNVLATRLHCAEEFETDSGGDYWTNIYSGSEIVVGWYIQTQNDNDAFSTTFVPLTTYATIGTTTIDAAYASRLRCLFRISQFDWHPFMWFALQTTNDKPVEFIPVGDIHNATLITRDDLSNLHKICLYSEFNAFAY